MKKIAVFASGSGSNAQSIAEYLSINNRAKVEIILSNRADAYVLQRAKSLNIEHVVFAREEFYNSSSIIDMLIERDIDFIVLAGFLWLVPPNLIEAFPEKIINIHPALLPKYGGKGMFGMYVHKAVIANKEKESGITIHYVNQNYDEGDIILQVKCKIEDSDTPESLAEKIHQLEYEYFPKTVEELVDKI